METHDVDTRGQRCPLPVLKARRRMKALAPGALLALTADDPLAAVDVPNYCREDGHTLVSAEETDGVLRFLIRKGP